MVRKTLFLFVTIVAVACAREHDADDSALKVINGKTVDETEHPAVYSIGGCTATFVSDSTMITAGHCVTPGGSVQLRKRSTARSTKIIRNPRYTGTGLQDTAIVLFPAGTSAHWLPVQKQIVQSNDDVLLVGYGCTLSTGKSGEKRIGTNKIAATSGGVISLRRGTTGPESGTDATLCPGDSGGPLLKGNTIVGIASYWDGGAGRLSGHADVTHSENQKFLQSTLAQGASINFVEGTPNGGGGQLEGNALFMALRQDSGETLQAIASAPKGVVKMRLCAAPTGDVCDAGTASAVESSNARSTADRSLHDFAGLVVSDQGRYVMVALDGSGKAVAKRLVKLQKR